MSSTGGDLYEMCQRVGVPIRHNVQQTRILSFETLKELAGKLAEHHKQVGEMLTKLEEEHAAGFPVDHEEFEVCKTEFEYIDRMKNFLIDVIKNFGRITRECSSEEEAFIETEKRD